jgi:hypothetical protein
MSASWGALETVTVVTQGVATKSGSAAATQLLLADNMDICFGTIIPLGDDDFSHDFFPKIFNQPFVADVLLLHSPSLRHHLTRS